MGQLVDDTKKKKELKGIADSVVLNALKSVATRMGIADSELGNLSGYDKKLIIKEARARLRLMHGRFQITKKDKTKIFEKEGIDSLLKAHSSTKERFEDYQKIKSILSDLKVNSILDIGCGINPISLSSKEITYYACDINEDELSLVREYFKNNNISGRVFFFDLENSDISSLPKADICIIFKVLDILNGRKKITLELLKKVNCSYFLVSFSTRKISGKPMNNPKRRWFESILSSLGYQISIFETKNEIFYIVKK